MCDFSELTNNQVIEARKYFKDWASSLEVLVGDVDFPNDEYWKNFCKKYITRADKLTACMILAIPVYLSEELANRFEKIILG